MLLYRQFLVVCILAFVRLLRTRCSLVSLFRLILEAWQLIADVQNNRFGRQCLALKVEGEGTDLMDRRLFYSFFPLFPSFLFLLFFMQFCYRNVFSFSFSFFKVRFFICGTPSIVLLVISAFFPPFLPFFLLFCSNVFSFVFFIFFFFQFFFVRWRRPLRRPA